MWWRKLACVAVLAFLALEPTLAGVSETRALQPRVVESSKVQAARSVFNVLASLATKDELQRFHSRASALVGEQVLLSGSPQVDASTSPVDQALYIVLLVGIALFARAFYMKLHNDRSWERVNLTKHPELKAVFNELGDSNTPLDDEHQSLGSDLIQRKQFVDVLVNKHKVTNADANEIFQYYSDGGDPDKLKSELLRAFPKRALEVEDLFDDLGLSAHGDADKWDGVAIEDVPENDESAKTQGVAKSSEPKNVQQQPQQPQQKPELPEPELSKVGKLIPKAPALMPSVNNDPLDPKLLPLPPNAKFRAGGMGLLAAMGMAQAGPKKREFFRVKDDARERGNSSLAKSFAGLVVFKNGNGPASDPGVTAFLLGKDTNTFLPKDVLEPLGRDPAQNEVSPATWRALGKN